MTILLQGLAACTTIPPHSLSRQDVSSWSIKNIEVVVPPSVSVGWPDGEYNVIKAKGLDPNNSESGAYTNTPEGRAALNKLLGDRISQAIRRDTGPRLTGQKPVKLIVTVQTFSIPSAGMRILVGGHPLMRGDVTVVDDVSGARLAGYSGGTAQLYAGQGFGGVMLDAAISGAVFGQADHADRLIASYVNGFNGWLFEGR